MKSLTLKEFKVNDEWSIEYAPNGDNSPVYVMRHGSRKLFMVLDELHLAMLQILMKDVPK